MAMYVCVCVCVCVTILEMFTAEECMTMTLSFTEVKSEYYNRKPMNYVTIWWK